VQSAAFGLGIVLSNWVVTLLTRRGGYDAETAGLIGALILIVGVVGRPAGGLYAHLRPQHTRAVLLGAMLLGASGTMLLGLAPPFALAVLGTVAVGLAAGVPVGPIVAGLGRTFPSAPGAAFAAMNTYALFVIVLGSPLLGATFSLPGDGLIGFVAAAGYWLVAAIALPGRELLSPSPEPTPRPGAGGPPSTG
jgi:MFS family permease